MNFRISFIAALLASTTMWGQSKVSPFTANYLATRKIQLADAADSTGTPATRAAVNHRMVSAYLHIQGTPDVEALAAIGVKVTITSGNILTVRMPLSAIPALQQMPFVTYIQLGTPVMPMMDKARVASGVDKVHAQPMAYTGRDVVVGIIDGGFDYTHPAFRDTEGRLRIKRVWEQAGTQGNAPIGFGYGVELATDEAILAAKADVNNQSHGTHVAAIAAGGRCLADNPFYGIATDADMVLVSKGDITANSANISDAIAYIYNYADSVGKPCVVNMSLGWNMGPHDGTSPFDRVADNLQGPGRLLIGSMGNYGNDATHVSKTFVDTTDSPLQAMVNYKITPSKTTVGGFIDLWADKGMQLDMQLVVTRQTDGSLVQTFDVMNLADTVGRTVEFPLTGRIKGSLIVTTEVNPFNGKPHAHVTLGVESRAMGMTVGFIVTPRTPGTVHAWTDANFTTFETDVPAGWSAGDTDYTLCEIGGTANNIISVGAYVTRTEYSEPGSSQVNRTDEQLATIASFSSKGPTIDGRMKPEIVAPGTFIAAAVNTYDAYRSAYPMASVIPWNDTYYYYAFMQGTSMAAPFVSGVVATWLQAMPSLDSQMLRSVLQATAMNDEFTNPATCGYGKIDAYAGLKEVLALSNGLSDDSINPVIPFVVRSTDYGLVVTFTRQMGSVELTLTTAAGVTVEHISTTVDVPGHTVTLPVTSASHGIHLLSVAGHVIKLAL